MNSSIDAANPGHLSQEQISADEQHKAWIELRKQSRAHFSRSIGDQMEANKAAAEESRNRSKAIHEGISKSLSSYMKNWDKEKLKSVPLRHHDKVKKYGWQCYHAPTPPGRSVNSDEASHVQLLKNARSIDVFQCLVRSWEDRSMIPETTKEVVTRHSKAQAAWENDKKWKHWEEVHHEKVPASWIPHPLHLIDESIRQRGAGDTYFELSHLNQGAWEDISTRGARRSEKSVHDLWVMSQIVESAAPPKTSSLEQLSAQLWSVPNEWRCNLYDEEHFATRWTGALKSGRKSQIDLNAEMRRTVEARAPGKLFELDEFIGSRNCAPTPREAFWAVAHALNNRDIETGDVISQ